jgi:hypothetical protein
MSRRVLPSSRGFAAQPLLPTRVPGVVRALARWAVLSSAAALQGCAADGDGAMSEPDPWLAANCGSNGIPAVLARIDLDEAVEYAGIYGRDPGPVITTNALLMDEVGRACFHATDMDACVIEVGEAQKLEPRCTASSPCPPFLLVTRGDEVTRSSDRADMLALLGTIDTPDEALALAMFEGHTLRCAHEITRMVRGTETLAHEGSIDVRTEWEECGSGVFTQTLRVTTDGELVDEGRQMIGGSPCTVGRRPFGLCLQPAAPSRLALGAFFASAAELEAASVYAFERLARELAALCAPAELIAAAALAALDEVRHARTVGALARRWGAEPNTPRVTSLPLRAPFAIAFDNAVEGCVRETYGALVAHHQALAARDPEVRSALAAIAEDETRHSLLSWQVAAWLEPRLPPAEQAALASARAAALHQLQLEREPGLNPREAALIGWPAPHVASTLIAQLGRALQLG